MYIDFGTLLVCFVSIFITYKIEEYLEENTAISDVLIKIISLVVGVLILWGIFSIFGYF